MAREFFATTKGTILTNLTTNPDPADVRLRVRLHELLDRQDIHDVHMRYCRGLDRGDLDLLASAFHPDATQNQDGAERTVEELLDILRNPARAAMKSITHNVTNEQVQFEGDIAHSECYLFATHRIEYDGSDWTWIVSLRFLDRFECRDNAWRIAYRKAEYDWSRLDRVTGPPAGMGMMSTGDKENRTLRFADAEG